MPGKGQLLNATVNVAVLGFLGFVAFGPNGYVRRVLTEQRAAREQAAVVRDLWPDMIEGRAGASPLIVVFTDYQCRYCRQMEDVLASLQEEGLLDVVYPHVPVAAIHPLAEDAARAAICAEAQGRFQAMHRHLFSTQSWQSDSAWTNEARAVGVHDVDAFSKCLTAASTTERLARDRRMAEALGVRGTPTFVSPKGMHRGVATREQVLALAWKR